MMHVVVDQLSMRMQLSIFYPRMRLSDVTNLSFARKSKLSSVSRGSMLLKRVVQYSCYNRWPYLLRMCSSYFTTKSWNSISPRFNTPYFYSFSMSRQMGMVDRSELNSSYWTDFISTNSPNSKFYSSLNRAPVLSLTSLSNSLMKLQPKSSQAVFAVICSRNLIPPGCLQFNSVFTFSQNSLILASVASIEALALAYVFWAQSLISLFNLAMILSRKCLFFSPMTILVSSRPYSSLNCLYLSLVHAAPIYYNNSRKIISLIVLDEVGIEKRTQRTLEFIVALGPLQEALPSLGVDEHSLRKYQILQHLIIVVFGMDWGSSLAFLLWTDGGIFPESIVYTGLILSFLRELSLFLEVQWCAFVNLYGF